MEPSTTLMTDFWFILQIYIPLCLTELSFGGNLRTTKNCKEAYI